MSDEERRYLKQKEREERFVEKEIAKYRAKFPNLDDDDFYDAVKREKEREKAKAELMKILLGFVCIGLIVYFGIGHLWLIKVPVYLISGEWPRPGW